MPVELIVALTFALIQRLTALADIKARIDAGQELTEEDKATVRDERAASFDKLDDAIKNMDV